MEDTSEFDLSRAVQDWRESLSRSPQFRAEDLNELESHLRDSVATLQSHGLSEGEAFLIATRRIGSAAALGREFGKVNASDVWLDRALWMLVGIQGWWALYKVSAVFSRWVVVSGLASFNDFDRHAGSLLGGVSFAVIQVVALAVLLWTCRRLVTRPGGTVSRLTAYVVARRYRLALAAVAVVIVALVGTGVAGVAEQRYLQAVPFEDQRIMSLADAVLWIVQMIGFLALTAVLLRRRLARHARQYPS